MSRSLAFTERAVADLQSVRAWYTQPGAGPAAKRRLLRITLAIEGLVRLPCFYGEGAAPGTRVMICDGHRVVYEVDRDTGHNDTAEDIMILRILESGIR